MGFLSMLKSIAKKFWEVKPAKKEFEIPLIAKEKKVSYALHHRRGFGFNKADREMARRQQFWTFWDSKLLHGGRND